MYRLAQPDEFDAYSVAALMAVSDTGDLQKLLALAPVQRNILLVLPADTLQTLAAGNSITQLAMLANHMLEPQQSPTAVAQIAEEVAQGSVSIEELATPSAVAGALPEMANNAPGAGSSSGATEPAQAASGLQRNAENGNIRVPGILAVLAILVAASVVAVGYWQRRKAQRS
jgi:hypothetical protein